jgi:hypothetical protein
MTTKVKIAILVLSAFVSTNVALAQEGSASVNASVYADVNAERPGIIGQIRKIFNDDKKEVRAEYKDERDRAVAKLKAEIMERKDWRNGSSTGTATPTPWKDFRGDMKDIRIDMKMMLASITASQTAAISAKLGISIDELRARLASGTPLKDIVGDKLTKEEILRLLPMFMASGTSSTTVNFRARPLEERGFFNSLRARFFGEDRNNRGNSVNVNASTSLEVRPGFGNFIKRLFDF